MIDLSQARTLHDAYGEDGAMNPETSWNETKATQRHAMRLIIDIALVISATGRTVGSSRWVGVPPPREAIMTEALPRFDSFFGTGHATTARLKTCRAALAELAEAQNLHSIHALFVNWASDQTGLQSTQAREHGRVFTVSLPSWLEVWRASGAQWLSMVSQQARDDFHKALFRYVQSIK